MGFAAVWSATDARPLATAVAALLDDPDGPWQRAWPAARELGAPVDGFWDRIAVTGLVVPAAWLAGADWTVLWRRAAARSRRGRH